MGAKALKYCTVRKKIFFTGPTRAAKAEQKSLVPARQGTNQGRTAFICILWVPINLSFNSQLGPPLSSFSGEEGGQRQQFCYDNLGSGKVFL
jgi:hypothetical protein